MEEIIVTFGSNNQLATKHVIDIALEIIRKQKLDDWKLEVRLREEDS